MPRGCGEDVPQRGTLPAGAEYALEDAWVSKRSSGWPGRKRPPQPHLLDEASKGQRITRL